MAENKKPYVVGMDIGGTNTVFGIVNTEGKVIASDSIKTQMYDNVDDYVEAVCAKLIPLIENTVGKDQVQGMGVGAPNGNFYSGTIEFAPNLVWGKQVVPLAKMFSERVGIPVALTNDANAAAIGEMAYGAARGMKNFIMITLGTGVGSGIVINGQLVYGCDGFAGELGHTIAISDGRVCGCGRKGCLEAYCSATGVARTAAEILEKSDEPSLLRNVEGAITSKDVYDAAVQGDKVANEIFEYTGTLLGKSLCDFIAFSSPEAIILFGGLTKSGDYIMKPIQKAIDENVLPIFKGKAKLLVSELKDADAAVLGASALGWDAK